MAQVDDVRALLIAGGHTVNPAATIVASLAAAVTAKKAAIDAAAPYSPWSGTDATNVKNALDSLSAKGTEFSTHVNQYATTPDLLYRKYVLAAQEIDPVTYADNIVFNTLINHTSIIQPMITYIENFAIDTADPTGAQVVTQINAYITELDDDITAETTVSGKLGDTAKTLLNWQRLAYDVIGFAKSNPAEAESIADAALQTALGL